MGNSRSILAGLTINDLDYYEDIHIYNPRDINRLEKIPVEDFIYIKDTHNLDFRYIKNHTLDSYQKIYNFIKRLDQNGKKCKIVLTNYNVEAFNEVFLKAKLQNVKVEIDGYNYGNGYYWSLETYQKVEKKLNKLVKPILEHDFSPLEKYLAVYNIAKNFKPYKDCVSNYPKTSSLDLILFNSYMVCLGFSNLLVALGEKVGIKINEITVKFDGDDDNNGKECCWHSRCIVCIDDDKYNVHGLYMADPTWDNDLDSNNFNHALMTFDQMRVSRHMFYESPEYILDFHNFQEYNEQANHLFKEFFLKYQCFSNLEGQIRWSYSSLVDRIISSMKTDPKYDYFKSKKCKTEKEYTELLTKLGHYLLKRINKKVNDVTLIHAFIYTETVLGNYNNTSEVIDTYRENDLYYFPYRVDKNNPHRLIKRKV